MPIYRPRMMAVLQAPIGEETVVFPVRVRSASWTWNDHNHADEVDIETSWSEAGIDPRFIRDACLDFHLDDADAFGNFTPTASNIQFTGIARSVSRHASEAGASVSIKAQDFTSLFLDCKKFPAEHVPHFSDTLSEAWRRICAATGVFNMTTGKIVSTVEKLSDRLEFRGGVSPDIKVGAAVPPRIAKQGRVVPPANADAWGVWNQVVGSLGLVTWIEYDKCIVSTTADVYADNEDGVPVVVYGKNILDITESSIGAFSAKGVGIMAYNAQTGKTVEAVYPDPTDTRIQRHRVTAKKKRGTTQTIAKSEDYDWYEYHGAFTEDGVLARAKRAWEERSRQEMEGSFVTSEMRVETMQGSPFEMLRLRAGDSIRIELDTSIDRGVFASLASLSQRVAYLVERGYALGVASVLAKNAKEFLRRGLTFKVREVRGRFESNEDACSFSIEVSFMNRIVIEDALPA